MGIYARGGAEMIVKICKCDACGRIVDSPYKARMKEFYVGEDFENGHFWDVNAWRKTKIHLCKNCYKGLYCVATKIREERNHE